MKMKKKEPLLRMGDFAIWSAILGGVVGYQMWAHTTAPALTTAIATIGQIAG